MSARVAEFEVVGPWSLQTSRRFWEGFTPAALAGGQAGPGLRTVFCAEGDWDRAEAEVTQAGDAAWVALAGDGGLDAAATQVRRFLALDVDGRGWPEVGRRDPVIADAQARLPGLRPCGFQSPYEAAAWSVLSQRLRVVQAARLRAELIARHGEDGVFPRPHTLARLDLDLPGRKSEYLRAVAEAALDGVLDGTALRALDPSQAVQCVQRSRDLARSLPNWSCSAARTPPTRCLITNAGWTPRSSSSRHRPQPRRTLGGVAALSHLGRRPPPCVARGTHGRDRRPVSHTVRPDTLSDDALDR